MSKNCMKNFAPAYKKLFLMLMDTKYTIINNKGLHCIYFFVFNAMSDNYMKNLESDLELNFLLVLICCEARHKI